MTSSRPYLLKAFIEWILDNGLTPYLVVNAEYEGVHVPTQFIENGRIVLNISPMAIRDYFLEKTHIEFKARFSGKSENLYIPMHSILAIYAKENGRGMVFKDDEEDYDPEPEPTKSETSSSTEGADKSSKGGKGKGKGASFLKVVK